jgi:maltooligosyltrehalose trehalohydrolase
VLQWLRDFHLDGLRLDAVHEMHDESPVPYLGQLSTAVDELAADVRRPLAFIAESDRNDTRLVTARGRGGLGVTAQWDDDVHHALHWLLTGETQAYYGDFGSADAVGYALERGFLHDGRWSSFRGRTHGRPVDWSVVDPWRLVVSLQTHDQVGNRALGDRLGALVDDDLLACGAALLLTLPYTPMLFMGEEWGSRTPWQFFTSFRDAAAGAAITAGRREEFAAHGWSEAPVPDPQDPRTFERSRLEPPPAASPLLAWYRRLLRLRAGEPGLGPALASSAAATAGGLRCTWSPVTAGARPRWFATTRGSWTTAANLSDDVLDVPLDGRVAEVVASWRDDATPADDSAVRLGPRSAAVVRTSSAP